MRTTWMAVALGASMLVGCNQGEVPIGASQQSLLVGEWEGYIEHRTWPSGSDSVRLSITAATETSVTGAITFGTPASFPPPTTPTEAYPDDARCNNWDTPGPHLLEGYAFTILEPKVTDLRIRFGIQQLEPWKPYCELQTPVATGDGWYDCLPSGSSKYGEGDCAIAEDSENWVDVPCCQMKFCFQGGGCTCDASGCTIDMSPGGVSFDLEVEGNDADGSSPMLGNVRLDRVQ